MCVKPVQQFNCEDRFCAAFAVPLTSLLKYEILSRLVMGNGKREKFLNRGSVNGKKRTGVDWITSFPIK